MSDALTVPPGADAMAEFNAAFARYLVWCKKDQGPAIEDRGQKVRLALYQQFRAVAKTPAQLRAEIAALGYAVKRRALSKEDIAAQRSAFGLYGNHAGAKLKWSDTVVDTETEIKARIKSLRFLSVSFLFRSWRSAQDGQSNRFVATSRAHKQIGSALVRTEEGNENPSVSLTSLLAGAVEQNRKRNIAGAVLRDQAADMAGYIARKHQEYLQKTFDRTYAVALGALG